LRHTYEDCKSNHVFSSAVVHFGEFWRQHGRNLLANLPDDAEVTAAAQVHEIKSSTTRRNPDKGDTSAEARQADGLCLPEGWGVHARDKDRVLGFSSPGGRFYPKGKNVNVDILHRLGRGIPTPQKPEKPSKTERTPASAFDYQPLDDVLGAHLPSEQDAVTKEDRMLLPRVAATFQRYLEMRAPDLNTRQQTRDGWVVEFFKMFARAGRNFDALASQQFLELILRSQENHVRHGSFAQSLRRFSEFWRSHGGYVNKDKLDASSKELMNKALEVRPIIRDAPGSICGAGADQGGLCQRPKQLCVTCGTTMRCCKHSPMHSKEECREIFWATHNGDGQKTRTMRDFTRRPAAGHAGFDDVLL